jgi:hypothetical protein
MDRTIDGDRAGGGGGPVGVPRYAPFVLGAASRSRSAASPLVGLPAPTYPDPTGVLAFAGRCAATGCGLVAGGIVLLDASLLP